MQRDKMRSVVGGHVMKETSEEDFFSEKGGIKFTE